MCKLLTATAVTKISSAMLDRGFLCMVANFILINTVASVPVDNATADQLVTELTDEFFNWRIMESPEYALKYGLPFYESDVEEWNEGAFLRRLKMAKWFKERADGIDLNGIRDKQQKLNLKLLKYNLDTYIDGYRFRNYTSGFNPSLLAMKHNFEIADVNTCEKLNFWFSRIIKYTSRVKDQADNVRQVIASGMVLPCITVEVTLGVLEHLIGNSLEYFFAFQPWLSLDIMNLNETFFESGLTVCQGLREALMKWKEELLTHYTMECRMEVGAAALPGGNEFYAAALQFHTTKDMTPEKVHELGVKEVLRVSNEMQKYLDAEGYLSMADFYHSLLDDRSEAFSTTEEVINSIKETNTKIQASISKSFSHQMDEPLQIINLPGSGMASYTRASIDGERPAQIILDATHPEKMLKVYILPITLHEASPGHHLFMSHNVRSGLHNFRKLTEYRHAAQAPFNWPFFTASVEGWALYAESLYDELGFTLSSKEKLGILVFELFRAVRLVVDTGIHHYNWSLERAFEYMKEKTTLSEMECWQQLVKHISWPGHACAYKLGELKIKELRREAEWQLGERFDIKEFHEVILRTGPSPLEIIEDEVNDWIKEMKAKSAVRRLQNSRPWLSIAYWIRSYLRL